MVLAVAPTGLFSRRSGDWSVRYELRGISARDENGGGDLPLTTGEVYCASIAPRIARSIPERTRCT